MNERKYDLETICANGGYSPKNAEARICPIVQSTTFKYDSSDAVGDLFDLKAEGHMYSRISNPTVEVLEKKIAALEGGLGAVATSSGQSANLISILTIAEAGDSIIAASNLYGGTYTLFSSTLKKFGINTIFIPLNDEKALEEAIKAGGKLFFAESLSNPSVEVLDIEKAARICHKYNIPLIVDNTFPSPVLLRPFEFGVDIVTHSTTKYIDGHATSVGGIIVDSGKFNWEKNGYKSLSDKDPAYHGLSYTETFKEKAYITKARVCFIRDLGNPMSPFNAFLTNLGLETLHLRMRKHSDNALKIAKFLESHEKVEWVNYPGLESSPYYELSKKYLKNGASGVISFGIKGGLEASKKWIDSLNLISLVVHVGDLRSSALHPASMTHRQLSNEALEKAGVKKNSIRLSIGIENTDDLISDLKEAFEKIE